MSDKPILPIILTLKVPFWDYYSIMKPRTKPLCPDCEKDTMELVDNEMVVPPPFFEEWRCKVCRCRESYGNGDYGEVKVEVSLEEWEEHMLHTRQQGYLKRRYPEGIPANLSDYWQKDEPC